MPYAIAAVVIFIFLYLILFKQIIIFEYQKALFYHDGKLVKILEPGRHVYFRIGKTVTRVDMRVVNVTLPGQEIMSADNIGLKIGLVASYKLVDPDLAINKTADFQNTLYLFLQLNLRDVVGSLPIDELLAKRLEIGQLLMERSVEGARNLGVELLSVNIKDIMFPGDLKNIFAQVVNARHEGLAALERARGESAAIRNLANAAREFESNPYLLQLRLLHAIEKNPKSTIILAPTEEGWMGRILPEQVGKKPEKKNDQENNPPH